MSAWPSCTWEAGQLRAAAPKRLTVLRSGTWAGGVLNNAQLTVGAGSSLVLSGSGAKQLTGGAGVITNLGTVTWTGGPFNLENNARFISGTGALFDVQTDAPLAQNGGGTSIFQNEGTYLKSAGTGTHTLSLVRFVQSGTLGIGTGVVRVVGDYSQGSGATLQTRVAGREPGTGFGQLQVTGKATLDGALAVASAGGLDLAAGEALPFLTASSRAGFFTTATGGAVSRELYLTPTYMDRGVDLRVTGPGAVLGTVTRVNGQIRIRVIGVAGQRYGVEASTDFNDWILLSPLIIPGSGVAEFMAADLREFPHRCYRTVFDP